MNNRFKIFLRAVILFFIYELACYLIATFMIFYQRFGMTNACKAVKELILIESLVSFAVAVVIGMLYTYYNIKFYYTKSMFAGFVIILAIIYIKLLMNH